MIFVTVSPKQAEQYSYMCLRLKQLVNKMVSARKTLEGIADTSFDKSFAKCVYVLTSESLQCENEIRAQIDSLSCMSYENERIETKKQPAVTNITGVDSICNYLDEIYLKSYQKLLKDKNLGTSIKSLIKNQMQVFVSSLTQLRLFNDVQTAVS